MEKGKTIEIYILEELSGTTHDLVAFKNIQDAWNVFQATGIFHGASEEEVCEALQDFKEMHRAYLEDYELYTIPMIV